MRTTHVPRILPDPAGQGYRLAAQANAVAAIQRSPRQTAQRAGIETLFGGEAGNMSEQSNAFPDMQGLVQRRFLYRRGGADEISDELAGHMHDVLKKRYATKDALTDFATNAYNDDRVRLTDWLNRMVAAGKMHRIQAQHLYAEASALMNAKRSANVGKKSNDEEESNADEEPDVGDKAVENASSQPADTPAKTHARKSAKNGKPAPPSLDRQGSLGDFLASSNRRPKYGKHKDSTASTVEAQVTRQIGMAKKGVQDKGKQLESLSRLAWIFEGMSSGSTCVAVLRNGPQLYVTANKAGEAFARNTGHLVGALQSGKFDTPLSGETPDGVDVYFGQNELDFKEGADGKKQSKSRKGAKENLKEHRLSELARTKKDRTPAKQKVAKADAERRLKRSAGWFSDEDITQVKVVEGPSEEEIHAEMRMLDGLHSYLKEHDTKVPIVLGISKLCCGLCALGVRLFKELHPKVELQVQGTHGKTYQKWPVPGFVADNLERFAALGEAFKLDEGSSFSNDTSDGILNALTLFKTKDTRGTKGLGGTGYHSDDGEASIAEDEVEDEADRGRSERDARGKSRKRARSPSVPNAKSQDEAPRAAKRQRRGDPVGLRRW